MPLTRDDHSFQVFGHLTRDPESRDFGETSVCNFSVASNRRGRDGEETVMYVRCGAWGKLGQTIQQYKRKGDPVTVEGTLRVDPETGGPRIWTGSDGEPRASLEMFVQGIKFHSRGNGNGNGGGNLAAPTPASVPSSQPWDEEIPF